MKRNDEFQALHEKEFDVLNLLYYQGLGKKEIAERLKEDPRTVERHLEKIIDKFAGIDNRLYDKIGYMGRTATILKVYREHYLEDKSDTRPIFYVLRRDVRFEMDLTEDEVLVGTQVSIQSLRDQLAYVAHGLYLDDQSPQANASHRELHVTSRSPRVKVTSEEVIKDPKKPRFRVKFDPPLGLGEHFSYHYSIRSDNYFPMSVEQIKTRIAQGSYHLQEEECETPYTISTVTDHLYLQLTFPPTFETENEHVIVEVGHSGPRSEEEEQRIHDTSAFKKFIFGPSTRLILDLPQPLLNHRYRIRWRPLRLKDLSINGTRNKDKNV